MSRKQVTWRDAIVQVLEEAGMALHYRVIAERMAKQGLRTGSVDHLSKTVYSIMAKFKVFERV